MKKIFILIVTVFLLAGALCVSAFAADTDAPAADPAKGVVLRISAEKSGKQYPVVVADHTNFEDGWNAAMKLASDSKTLSTNGYKHIIVDIYSDWKAVDGEFSDDIFNGKGFNWDTIYFPKNVEVTLNLNGHTVDRGLTAYQYNGEVMYVDAKARVTINNGTITGGWSCNGAGGIHVNDGAYVTLNNVNLIGNTAEDDDGAAIALYNGAHLTMNGGSMSNNVVYSTTFPYYIDLDGSRGVLYAKNSHVILKNVTFNGNVAKNGSIYGLVAYFVDSTAIMDNCVVENNGYVDTSKDKNYVSPLSLLFSTQDLDISIRNTVFKNNGSANRVVQYGDASADHRQTSLINLETHLRYNVAYAAFENCTFTGNKMDYLFDIQNVELIMKKCTVTDNQANVAYDRLALSSAPVAKVIEKCTFNNNHPGKDIVYRALSNPGTFCFSSNKADVSFVDCDFGNSTFTNKNYAKFKNSSVVGSIFNEGSIVTIISIAALVSSVISITMTAVSNKKKKVAVTEKETNDKE